MTYEEQLVADRPTIEERDRSMRVEVACRKVTLQDMVVLTAVVQAALPRLDFKDPCQEAFGRELLRLVNRVGAAYEYCRERSE